MILPRIWLVNIALLAVVIVSGVSTYRIWSHPPHWQPGRDGVDQPDMAPVRMTPGKRVAQSSFNVVTDRNLFSESRRTIVASDATPLAVEEPKTKNPVVKPEKKTVKVNGRAIELYGVAIAGSMRKALITNPFQKGHERKTMWVAPADELEDYQVWKIEPQRVLLRKAGKVYQVSLYEKDKPRTASTGTVSPAAGKPDVVHAGTVKKAPPPKKTKAPSPAQPSGGETIMTPFGPLGGKPK